MTAANAARGEGDARAAALFDPYTVEMIEDPYPMYRRLRDLAPVSENSERGFWALSRFADVQAAARDWRTFSSGSGVNLEEKTSRLFGPGSFLEQDPPRHDLLRGAVRHWYTPQGVDGLRKRIEALVAELLDAIEESDEADLAGDFAWALPTRLVSELIGVPVPDRELVERWFADVFEREVTSPEVPATAVVGAAELRSYFAALAGARRRRPRDDLVSHLAAVQVAGQPLGEEIVGMCLLLYAAGTDTTACLLTNGLLLLDRHPEARAALLADQELLPAAMEEMLRFESPVQFLCRVATEPVELHGTTIPVGARVAFLFGAANRDERRFANADVFDIARPPLRHVAFGEGIHHCLGAPLARLEGAIALRAVLERIPHYAVCGPVERLRKHLIRGLVRLPVRVRG